MNNVLARFRTCTVLEVYVDLAMALDTHPYYYVQEPRPGQTDLKLVTDIVSLPDGSYRLTAGVGNHQQFVVSADQVLYFPPEA